MGLSIEAARYLGYKVGGRLIHEVYDQSTGFLDLVTQILAKEQKKGSDGVFDIVYAHLSIHSRPTRDKRGATLLTLVRSDPELLRLARNLDMLELCLKHHSNAWMSHEDFQLDDGVEPWKVSDPA
jgi:hypothetical protein